MIILKNSQIYTLDPDQPSAQALLIDSGRILGVGTEAEILSLAGERDQASTYDAGGRIILPGLIDAHLHLQSYALGLQKVDCETRTLAECLGRVSERARATPPGEWILGHGWNQNEWPDCLPSPAGPRRMEGFPNAADLDGFTPQNPVYLTAKSLHVSWANSAALCLSGVDAQTPDPPGGRIQRDEGGDPTGILFESAMDLVDAALPEPTLDQVAGAIQSAQATLAKMGLTGVHDFDRRQCFAALQLLNTNGDLHLRVVKSIPLEDLSHAAAVGLRSGFGNDFLRIGSVKAFADGALGPRTAAMLQPYENEPQNTGMLLLDAEELLEHGRLAIENGLSLAVHAIGDRANHEVLDAFDKLGEMEKSQSGERQAKTRLRHRIEHVQIIHPEDAPRFARLGVIASMQPIHAASDYPAADRYWGDRSANAYAWRTLLQNGARLAFGSDAPVESPNPFWGLHAALTRRRVNGDPGPEGWYPAQRLTIAEALHGFTAGAAYAAHMERLQGNLAPGFFADLLVLDVDPFACQPEQLKDIQPLATMIGGAWVWRSTFP